jgi:hypothetical protein
MWKESYYECDVLPWSLAASRGLGVAHRRLLSRGLAELWEYWMAADIA